MFKLLLYRVAPIGAAVAIFSSALSPLQPMLTAFAKAADALTGKTSTGGVDIQPPDLKGEVDKVKDVVKGKQPSAQSKTLQQLASDLSEGKAPTDPDDPYGHKAGARGPKPIALPPTGTKKR